MPPSLTSLDYLLCGVYLAASLCLGLKAGGKQKNLDGYLLAGQQMHWFVIAVAVLAALFSGISFIGAPAETYGHNLVYLWTVLAFFVATPIANIVFVPFFFRLHFYTAYEYLEHRFDLRIRRLSSAAFVFRVTLWLALALFVPSLVISEITGLPLWLAIAVTGGVTIFYTTVGGMRAVIYTDMMQLGVLVAGILLVLGIALAKTPGGAAGAWQIAEAGGRTRFFDWSLSLTDRMTVLGAFFGGIVINLVSLVTDQVSVQRYLTAASLRECQKALWVKLLLTLPLVVLFYFTGVVLYAFYASHPEAAEGLKSADRVLPYFVVQNLGAPMPGILVAALLAATMSTVSAGINSLTTAVLFDFVYTGKMAPADARGEARRVTAARVCTVGFGLITTVLALGVSRLGTIVEAANKISGFFGGPLLGIFFLGVFSRRANATGTLLGSLCGFGAVVTVGMMTHVSFMWYAAVGLAVTWLAGGWFSRFFPEPTERQRSFSRAGASAEAGKKTEAAEAAAVTVV